MPKEIKQLRKEFGIHFKNSPDELGFLEVFIDNLLKAQNQQLLEKIGGILEKNIANTQTQAGKVRIWECGSIIIMLENLKNQAKEDIKQLLK